MSPPHFAVECVLIFLQSPNGQIGYSRNENFHYKKTIVFQFQCEYLGLDCIISQEMIRHHNLRSFFSKQFDSIANTILGSRRNGTSSRWPRKEFVAAHSPIQLQHMSITTNDDQFVPGQLSGPSTSSYELSTLKHKFSCVAKHSITQDWRGCLKIFFFFRFFRVNCYLRN